MSQPLTGEHFDEVITAFKAHVDERFDDIAKRVPDVEERVAGVEYRLNRFETRLDRSEDRTEEKFTVVAKKSGPEKLA